MDRASAFPKPFDAENEANTKRETMKRERESQITHRRREKTPVFGDRTLERSTKKKDIYNKTRFFGEKGGWIGPGLSEPFRRGKRREYETRKKVKKRERKRKLVTAAGGR